MERWQVLSVWTSFFKSPIYIWVTLHFEKLNQIIPTPKDIFNKYLLTELLIMGETEFCATKPILLCDPGVHVGTIFPLKPKAKVTMQGKQALFTNQVVEQATEDRRLLALKKGVPVVKYIVNYGVDKSICLTTQEHL